MEAESALTVRIDAEPPRTGCKCITPVQVTFGPDSHYVLGMHLMDASPSCVSAGKQNEHDLRQRV